MKEFLAQKITTAITFIKPELKLICLGLVHILFQLFNLNKSEIELR